MMMRRVRSFAVLLVVPWLATCSFQSLEDLRNLQCPTEHKACILSEGPACVRVDLPEHGCAQTGCSPCAFDNATARCGNTGVCEIASCALPWADCNGDPKDGCEANVNSDPASCGLTCQTCLFEHATRLCISGYCRMGPCHAGFRDCNHDPADGCETAVVGNALHCGECNTPCAPEQQCDAGSCR